MWANAVLLTESKRNSLTKDSLGNYTPGQTIGDSESSGVLAFYVWIPRYKYKVWNIDKIIGTDSYDAENTGIDVVFENGIETTGTITCEYSFREPSENEGEPNEECEGNNGDYYTHPAFTFEDDELTGIWVGKFELSSETPDAHMGGGYSISLTPRVLPNVRKWADNPVTNYWKVIKDMQISSNIYGLSTDLTILDTHMTEKVQVQTSLYQIER